MSERSQALKQNLTYPFTSAEIWQRNQVRLDMPHLAYDYSDFV